MSNLPVRGNLKSSFDSRRVAARLVKDFGSQASRSLVQVVAALLPSQSVAFAPALPEAEVNDPKNSSENRRKYLLRRSLSQGGVLWWALSLLDIDDRTVDYKIRDWIETAQPERVASSESRLARWTKLRQKAEELAAKKSLDEWRREAEEDPDGETAKKLRHAALRSPRAFVQIANVNHRGIIWELDDFQVITVNAMRKHTVAGIFLPLEHGKSAIGSILVPLMDWAEWPDATEARVYWNTSNANQWVGLLQDHVEFNKETHQVFPWIRRPQPEDRAQYWSRERFSIGGRTDNLPSFSVLTAKMYSVGLRYSRTCCDDWVNSENAHSQLLQDRLEDYLLSGPMTFREFDHVPKDSTYGTKWGTMSYCGTFFDKRDVGYRFHKWCTENGYTALKFDVYPLGQHNDDILLWMRPGGYEHIMDLKKSLRRMFNKRMRNMIVDDGAETFNPDDVDAACEVSLHAGGNYRFGTVPPNTRAMIGFDPAMGSRKKGAANPAICVYGEAYDVDDHGDETGQITAHFIAWEELRGYDFHKQCNTIIQWARQYMLPVVIEKNTLQKSYADQLRVMAPDVRVYDHQTGHEKWDVNDGIETFSPFFQERRAVIHADMAPTDALQVLVEQLVDWPMPKNKDVMMAFWFARSKMRKRQKLQSGHQRQALPSYLQGDANYWRLR